VPGNKSARVCKRKNKAYRQQQKRIAAHECFKSKGSENPGVVNLQVRQMSGEILFGDVAWSAKRRLVCISGDECRILQWNMIFSPMQMGRVRVLVTGLTVRTPKRLKPDFNSAPWQVDRKYFVGFTVSTSTSSYRQDCNVVVNC
jgi:hypothetical protein